MPPSPPTYGTNADSKYLRGQPPTLAALQGGLSVFVAVVVLRLCIRRFQQSTSKSRTGLNTKHTLESDNHNYTRYSVPSLSPDSKTSSLVMDEKKDQPIDTSKEHQGRVEQDMVSAQDERADDGQQVASTGADGLLRNLISRSPSGLPLTPPELSSTIFTLDEQPPPRESLFQQPNPDYITPSTSSSDSQPSMLSTSSAPPRHLSYHRTIPIGVPASGPPAADGPDLYLPANSYPSTSPILPPPPPEFPERFNLTEGQPRAGQKDIDLHGEIFGVLDSSGAGWTRHTRVYGGGVCLACASAQKQHGEGGFYGPNVLPEEMR